MSFLSLLGTQVFNVVKNHFSPKRSEFVQQIIAEPKHKFLYHVHARRSTSMIENLENAIDSFRVRYGQMPAALVVSSLERLELPENEWLAFQYDIAGEQPPVPLYTASDKEIQAAIPYNALLQNGYVFCIGIDNQPAFSMPMLLEQEKPGTVQTMLVNAVQELQTVFMPAINAIQAVRVSFI